MIVVTPLGSNQDDTPQINAALAADPWVQLDGAFTCLSAITFQDHERTLVGGKVYSLGPYAFDVVGAREITLQNVKFAANGAGGRVTQMGGSLRLYGCKINTGGNGLELLQGSGFWAGAGTHFSCSAPGNYTNGVLAADWDTAGFSETLFEEYDCGFRFGGVSGSVGNVTGSGIIFDRCAVGINLEPTGTGEIQLVRLKNLGILTYDGGTVPVNIDGRGTVGHISRVNLEGHSYGFSNKTAWLNGVGSDVVMNLTHY